MLAIIPLVAGSSTGNVVFTETRFPSMESPFMNEFSLTASVRLAELLRRP